MELKKNLKINNGQCSLEYLVLFAIIASITLLSITRFLPDLRAAGNTFFDRANANMR